MSQLITQRRMEIRPLIPLCLAAFAGFLNLFGMSPFFADIADDLGSSVSLIGYAATGAMLMTAVAGAAIGPLIDRLGGIRRTLVIGLVLAALSAVATGLAVNYETLLLARLLAGIGGSITGGVTVGAAALIYQGRERQRALAIVTASMAMAVVIGIVLMTTMADPYGWRGAFLALAAGLVGIALLNRVMLAAHRPPPEDDAMVSRVRALIDAYRPIIGHRPLRRLLLAAALHPAIINGSTAYVGAFLVIQYDASTRLVGLVFSLIGSTYFVGNLLAGNLPDRKPHFIFSAGVTLMGLFWITGYLAPGPAVAVVAASFAIATFVGGIAWVTLLTMIADRTPANLGTAMVLTSSLLSLGAAGGIALSAGLLDLFGYAGITIGIGVLLVLAGIVGWVGPAASDDPVQQAPGIAADRVLVSQNQVDSG